MKARVDIEIYERWIAIFRKFYGIRGYYERESICEESKENLCNQIRRHFKYLNDKFLEEIIWEKRVKFKRKDEEYDLLIESKSYERVHSDNPIFDEDDKRIEKLWRENPNIFHGSI